MTGARTAPPTAPTDGPATVPGARSTAPGTPDGASSRLPRARIGIVPIVWNNADLGDPAAVVPADIVLDEVARIGYAGVQDGVGFPSGPALRDALARRGLALAEVYAALTCGPDGPPPEAIEVGRRRLAALHEAGGDVLVVALAFSAGRLEHAGRATRPGTPSLSDTGWRELAATLERLALEARAVGHRLAFHAHAGTFVETPDELGRLLAATEPELVGVCLDTGHCTVGGGDPVAAVREHGERIVHVHLKDVAAEPLQRIRDGAIAGFMDALRARIFTELGSGVVDVDGVLDALASRGYVGWLMVEQDTTWRSPSESAAIGRRVLESALYGRRGAPPT